LKRTPNGGKAGGIENSTSHSNSKSQSSRKSRVKKSPGAKAASRAANQKLIPGTLKAAAPPSTSTDDVENSSKKRPAAAVLSRDGDVEEPPRCVRSRVERGDVATLVDESSDVPKEFSPRGATASIASVNASAAEISDGERVSGPELTATNDVAAVVAISPAFTKSTTAASTTKNRRRRGSLIPQPGMTNVIGTSASQAQQQQAQQKVRRSRRLSGIQPPKVVIDQFRAEANQNQAKGKSEAPLIFEDAASCSPRFSRKRNKAALGGESLTKLAISNKKTRSSIAPKTLQVQGENSPVPAQKNQKGPLRSTRARLGTQPTTLARHC
jgi:hypothetical protein